MTTRSPLVGALLVSALASLALAHTHPRKAKLLTSSLVQSYAPCLAPNATATGGRPACEPAVAVDETCLLAHEGVGLLEAVVKETGIKVKATLKGLEPACNGSILAVAFRIRATTHCTTEHCTTVDEDLVSTSTCTVANGKCTIRGTIETGLPSDEASGLQILSCGVRNGDRQTFSCGVLMP
jgi:hypothetical protein